MNESRSRTLGMRDVTAKANVIFAGVVSPEAPDLQKEADALMAELKTLDFADLPKVVHWVGRFVEPSNTAGVNIAPEVILEKFAGEGFLPGMGSPTDFEGTSRRVVGNALECLEDFGFMHPAVGRQVQKWQELYADVPGVIENPPQ